MAGEPYRGIFAVLCTPFRDDLSVDEEALARVVDFACRCGAEGVVWPVLYGEFYTLSDAERARGYRVVVEAAGGRMAVVAGVAGTSIPHVAELGRAAAAAGADATIGMPPYTNPQPADSVRAYYRTLAGVTGRPVIVQNAPPPLGSPVTPAFLASIARDYPLVSYVKEEVPPALHHMSEILALKEPNIKGLFGGGGGIALIEELRRGAVGNMPAVEWADILVAIYQRFCRGDEAGARAMHRRFLAGVTAEVQGGLTMVKEIMMRRGVLKSSVTRIAGTPLDAEDRYQLDRLMEDFADLMTVKG